MELQLIDIGKRYANHWLFRHVQMSLTTGDVLSVQGGNGFGKSTLMQIIYGFIEPSEGQVLIDGKSDFKANQLFSYTGPYMELPMSCSIEEIHALYSKANKIEVSLEAFYDYTQLKFSKQSPIQFMSSGQIQKLKTALCFCSTSPILLLDEPLSNIDHAGELWYKNCLNNLNNKIVVIAGNYEQEFSSAKHHLDLKQYKTF
jgi:ABC-type multidrug transport system ATPase subunit